MFRDVSQSMENGADPLKGNGFTLTESSFAMLFA